MLSDYFKDAILNHILKNVAISDIGDASGLPASATAGNLYISFHTGNPVAGDQSTSEATYGGYARKSINRGSDWTVSSGEGYNATVQTFDTCTSGSNTITHVGIGTALSGAGTILFVYALGGDSFVVSTGIIPSFDIAQLSIAASCP
jgi:hypothetical protein